MSRTDFSEFACSLAQALQVAGEWWTPLIVRDLYLGVDTFDELVADLGVSRSLLSRRLTDLVDAGIVMREPYRDRPDRHRYRLTEAGRELVPIFAALTAWGDRWTTPPLGQPLGFEHRPSQAAATDLDHRDDAEPERVEPSAHRCVPTVCCDHCREPLTVDELHPVAGPGARARPGTALVGGRPLRT